MPTSPRGVLVACAALAVACAAWSDRELVWLVDAARRQDRLLAPALPGHQGSDADPDLTYPDALAHLAQLDQALRRLRRADEAFGEPLEAFELEALDAGTGEQTWDAYFVARASRWPAYRAALDDALAACARCASVEPDNGLYDALTGLLQIELALDFGPADPLFDMEVSVERSASRLDVADPEGLLAGLSALDRGLGQPRFDAHMDRVAEASWLAQEGPALRRLDARLELQRGFGAAALGFVRERGSMLTLLARRERQLGRPRGEAILRRARRLGLRLGAQARLLPTLLVGSAVVRRADWAWQAEAADRGDLQRLTAAGFELDRLQYGWQAALGGDPRDPLAARTGTALERVRVGGVGDDDDAAATASRQLDYAVLESLFAWCLILGLCGWLPLAAIAARRHGGARASSCGLPQSGWTLGDALSVVLPTVGGALVLSLWLHRLSPAGDWAAWIGPWPFAAPALRLAALGVAACFAARWLLRRQALAHHGLDWERPALARAALGAVLAGAALAVFGLGPYRLVGPGLLSLTALGVGLALGWRGAVFGSPLADRERAAVVRGFEARVGASTAALALCLVSALQLAHVAPRRTELAERTDAWALQAWVDGAQRWRVLRETLGEWEAYEPEGPRFETE